MPAKEEEVQGQRGRGVGLRGMGIGMGMGMGMGRGIGLHTRNRIGMGIGMEKGVEKGVGIGMEKGVGMVGVSGTDTSLLHGPDAQPRSTSGPTAMSCVPAHTDQCSATVCGFSSVCRALAAIVGC